MIILFVILLSGPFETGTVETHRKEVSSMAKCLEVKAAMDAVPPTPGHKLFVHCLPK